MPYATDERLKSYLDTNQLFREQMCRAVLATDKRFSEVRPRHPRGGPDGGRDMEAVYRQAQLAYGAVGFVNQANDSDEQKKRINKKFSTDLLSALGADPKPEVFVFFTNLNPTIGEKDTLSAEARQAGITYCDIFDRERIRISLDSPDGFSIRFQYLGLPLSEEEQASFFARWGDDIQSLVASGFQRLERTLDRILFLQEATDVLIELTFFFELNREYLAREIGHFRAFCMMHLKEIKHDISEVLFGSSDRADRMSPDGCRYPRELSGIAHGISGGQWEQQVHLDEDDASSGSADDQEKYQQVGYSSSIGMEKVRFVRACYSHDHYIRISPRLVLKDLDQAMFMPVLNRSLAGKLKAIHVYANGYKLKDIQCEDFRIDATAFDPKVPVEFAEDELADPWVRIRPSDFASNFSLEFYGQTPKKLFLSRETIDSLAKPARLEEAAVDPSRVGGADAPSR